MAGINMERDEAFVSLVTNNGYALGALVLGNSLRSVNTNRQLVLMITRDVHPQVRQELLRVWDRLVVVNILDSEDTTNLALLGRPDLGVTFTKLHAWKLTEYNKCVFLDSDVMVIQNIDDLFDRPEISAAPDIGWPDCFNSGVFVFVPSLETHEALVAHALVHGSFDGGDQGLLNSFFSNWSLLGPAHRLPFTYNLHSNSSYTYSPAFNRFQDDVKVVHFLGSKKPWQYSVNLESGQVLLNAEDTASAKFLQRWWDIYHRIAHDVSSHEIRQLTSGIANIQFRNLADEPQSTTESDSLAPTTEHVSAGQSRWECGQIDYVGVDRFDNILSRLDESLVGSTPVNVIA